MAYFSIFQKFINLSIYNRKSLVITEHGYVPRHSKEVSLFKLHIPTMSQVDGEGDQKEGQEFEVIENV